MKKYVQLLLSLLLFSLASTAHAAAFFLDNINSVIEWISSLMIVAGYVAAIALLISAIGKFQRHRENPQHIHIGVPIAEVFAAISLIMIPTIAHFADFIAEQDLPSIETLKTEKANRPTPPLRLKPETRESRSQNLTPADIPPGLIPESSPEEEDVLPLYRM